MTEPHRLDCAYVWLAASLLLYAPAHVSAREDGFATDGCSGCHNGGQDVAVTITPSTSSVAPNQTVRLTVAIAARNGDLGGFYLRATQVVGSLALVAGESTRLTGGGVVHTAPKRSSDGARVRFAVDWTAPGQPGDVEFLAFGLSANGDGRSSGDGAGSGTLSLAFGCVGSQYFADHDGDGYGSDDLPRMACAQPPNYAVRAGDCEDNDERIHPGAGELCNARDDDCDEQVDEQLPIASFCEDLDGDGHGGRGARMMMGCGPTLGFGLCDDDCNDDDANVYPGALELCNGADDNCNGRSDEDARETCGVGWCRRNSESCSSNLCVPGQPRSEECNALDDDCDGMTDEGVLCARGQRCHDGVCGSGPEPNDASDAGAQTTRDGGAAADPLDAAFAAADASGPASASRESGCGVRSAPESPASRGHAVWLLAGTLGLALWARAPLARGRVRARR